MMKNQYPQSPTPTIPNKTTTANQNPKPDWDVDVDLDVEPNIKNSTMSPAKDKVDEDPPATVVARAVKTFSESIHPRLGRLPSCSACTIATIVLLVNVAAVVILTLYNWQNINIKLTVLDAEWEAEKNIYSKQFKSPVHLCNSFGPEVNPTDNETYYTAACLLSGLTCQDYGDPFCPEQDFHFKCSDDLPNCGDLGSFASVVYIDGPSFTVAFGAALGYTVYVQAFVLFVCLVLRHYCCRRCGGGDHEFNLREEFQTVASGLGGKKK
jgi:hypothetical protein